MKCSMLLLLFLPIMNLANAQDSLGNITELQRLLKERKDHFQEYSQAADQRSGIFGNKTKRDLEQSREILFNIVKTDNHILEELDRAISNRGMAKADYSFEETSYKQTIEQLSQATDTLNKQLEAQKQISASMQNKADSQRWILYVLAGIIGLLSVYIFWSKARK